ncbi:acetyltransferase (GNAT) family protein [Micromonospora sp. A202]|uniref:GNAT family N-acetyltransferase n=1 Tax=Micromonospora sp. A202 TaxID=2572899 RepID=UPI0011513DB1|nr:GNAT family N-acetyltransferase [Micromonospora sp. A202]TQJ23803.1 acetyltransferase (GNAT) family protein [Micromonospora sp. A202]
MDTVPRIRAVRWADKDHVAALIADALNSSPLATWLIPDPGPRRRILTDVLGIWVEHAMFYGDIYLTDDAAAASVGFHRYRPIPPPANYSTRMGHFAGPHSYHFDLLDWLLAKERPTEPHYHLAFLAVQPAARRTGHGTALLNHHRSRLDHVNLLSWTSTTLDAQRLHIRHGYTPGPAIDLPEGLVVCSMRRSPRDGEIWPTNKTSATGGQAIQPGR